MTEQQAERLIELVETLIDQQAELAARLDKATDHHGQLIVVEGRQGYS